MQFVEKKRILFLGLPWTFTRYSISEEMINVRSGALKTVENDCYMYKVQDVKLEKTLLERMLRLGTVICFTGDSTDQTLRLIHVKNSNAIKDFILEASERERRKKRTLNTLDIGNADSDADL